MAQEFDVVFTDGKSLYIVECKAGNLTSEQVYKLSDCVRTYGGVLAKGILASALGKLNKTTRKRIEEAKNLTLISDQSLHELKQMI